MNAANTVPAVLLHYAAPDAAQPAQMETNAPDDVPAVLAQLAAVGN